MDDLRSLRTKVDRKKRPFWRSTNEPVPESPPEPLQCEHCLGNYVPEKIAIGLSLEKRSIDVCDTS